ncbi:MAG: lamin tail domain-containing protein [Flavobacteriales bacterium]|nr:lamin tail domain-containing protein [Flavobacteriales bacterium]
MKKTILLLQFVAIGLGISAQNCSDLFISEYVEGWSNNKALEIYNPTGAAIDASGYGIVRFQNGSTDFGEISYLTGVVVPSHDVVVVVLEKLDSLGEGLEAPVWDELQAVADVYMNPNYDDGIWPMYFNGNDAVALLKNDGETLVDLFGRIGEGSDFPGWGPYTDDLGAQFYISEDHTLIRKSFVDDGVSTNPTSFDIELQWDSLPANTFTELGFHQCVCGTGVEESESAISLVRLFPNPVQGANVSIVSNGDLMDHIAVIDQTGRQVITAVVGDRMYRLDVETWPAGLYYLEVVLRDGRTERHSFIR